MKFDLSPTWALVVIGLLVSGKAASAADYDLTYSGPWRNKDDIVTGWDWTLPAGVAAARHSGIYNFNSDVPADFPGNHMKEINWKWRDVEPTQGNYDFSGLIAQINDPNYDGAMLNFRGMVWEHKYNGKVLPGRRTAPDWLSGAPKIQERVHHGSQITNLKISDPQVKKAFLAMIAAFGKARIASNTRLMGAILHGVSSSRGEEWTGKQASTNDAEDAMFDYITAWAHAYVPHTKKLMWIKPVPARLYDHAIDLGMGSRDGIVKRWLAGTLMDPAIGQIFDAKTGYITVDETIPEIAEGRAFLGQNEIYQSSNTAAVAYGLEEFWPLRYRHANLRALQMRRNMLWTDKNSTMNPAMLNWVSLELGKNVNNAPDAWVLLMRSWVRESGENRAVHNFERWLYQRDINGITTTPVINRNHGFNAAGNDLLPKQFWNSDIARKARSMGIAVDDRFLSGSPHSVTIKVTYFDNNSERWSLVYDSLIGEDSRSVQNGNTGKVRTATFFFNNFSATARNKDFDFNLESSKAETPFMFVRLIKLTPDSGSGPGGPGGPGPDPGPGPGPSPSPDPNPSSPPVAPQDLTVVP